MNKNIKGLKTLENRYTVIISPDRLICETASHMDEVKSYLGFYGITAQHIEDKELYLLNDLTYAEATYIEEWFEDYRYQKNYIESFTYRMNDMEDEGETETERYRRLMERKNEAEKDLRNNELRVLLELISKYNR